MPNASALSPSLASSVASASPLPLTLVVPVYREEEENLRRLSTTLLALRRDVPRCGRTLFVYDRDDDPSLPVLLGIARESDFFRVVKNGFGAGLANALRAGLTVAENGPALVVMADLSDDLSVVPLLLARYDAGARIVCPSRYMPGGRQLGGPPLKGFLSRLAGAFLHLRGFPVRDVTNNFRLYDASLVRELGVTDSRGPEWAFEVTVKAFRAGIRIEEVPTVWRERDAGKSHFTLRNILPPYLRWFIEALRPVRPS